ncbi:putative cell survival pathways protein [[Neocosmospora] mangrovei]
MFNWAKQQLANVAGTQEPIYGPEAIKSVAVETEKTPFTESKREDLKWQAMDSTSVETQTIYIFGENNHVALLQVIYSNVAGIRTTCQFNCKVFYPDRSKPILWCSTPLSNHDFSEDMASFYADDLAVELSEDGTFYTIKSMNDERAIVNLKLTRTSPGFQAGATGKTLYGTDLENPWGSMRHVFWPRCVAEGTITTDEGPLDFKGRGFYVYALQGMKPHHAASRWNFVNFQGPTYSAVMMEFTSTPSYGSTLVNVGGIAKDGEIIIGGSKNTATHTQVKNDSENDWPEPSHAKYTWSGTDKDGKTIEATSEGPLEERVDRVDVMAEVPGFVKTIVAAAAGTKPYIYQYHPKLPLKLKIGDQEIVEEGTIFTEATFIS